MALPVWVSNLVAYSLQVAILAAAGTLLAYLFRLRHPRVALAYWQAVLLACLFLPCLQRWHRPILGAAISGYGHAVFRIPDSGLAAPAGPPQMPWDVLWAVLAAGIVLKLAWLLLGFVRLHLFRNNARVFMEPSDAVRDVQRRTGIWVPLFLSHEIDSPVTFGFRSPNIILPLSFQALSEPCREAVLCHELLHVRRRDWVAIIAEDFVGAILWFHPAVWWLLSRIRLSREQAVDREVVRLTGNRQPYLDALLEFARTRGRPGAVPAPLFLKESHLVERVALLLKEVSMKRSTLIVHIVCMSLLLMGTVHFASGWFPLTGSPLSPERQDSTATALPRPSIRVGGDVQESKLIRKVEPVYPEEARRLRLSGIVKLGVTVDEEGFVRDARVQMGHPVLARAAVDAVHQWRYSATLLNGQPVPVETTVTCFFGTEETPAFMQRGTDAAGAAIGSSISARPAIPANAHVTVTAERPQNEPPPAPPGEAGGQVRAPLRGPLRVGGNVQESKLVHRAAPVYPERAIREGIEGIVLLLVTVNEEGFVYELRAAQENNPILEAAAIDAVKEWQYSPTLLNGTPVPVQAMVTVVFNLK